MPPIFSNIEIDSLIDCNSLLHLDVYVVCSIDRDTVGVGRLGVREWCNGLEFGER